MARNDPGGNDFGVYVRALRVDCAASIVDIYTSNPVGDEYIG